MLDLLVTGGRIIDGTGRPAFIADVGVKDDRIVEIGRVRDHAKSVIDAAGLTVAPGLIDIHTHYDAQVMWDPALTPSSLHGFTTVIGGNCGFGIAPITPGDVDYLLPMLARVEGIPVESLFSGLDPTWHTFGEWLDSLEGRIGINAGFLVGHSTIRRLVMGKAAVGAPANESQLEAMLRELDDALSGGALGFSSSRSTAHNDHNGDPVPSRFATEDELLALCGQMATSPGTTIELAPTAGLFEPSTGELMASMSSRARRPLNWNLLVVRSGEEEQANREAKLAASDLAAGRGAHVSALVLPDVSRLRLTFETGVAYETLPGWADVMHLPHAEKIGALKDPHVRERLERDARSGHYVPWRDWERTTIADAPSPEFEPLVGQSIAALARDRRMAPFELLCSIAVESDLAIGLRPPALGDDDGTWAERARVCQDRRVLVGGTDAGAHLDMLTSHSAYTAFLTEAVRRRELMSWERAIQLLTAVPAQYLGLRGRGRVQVGTYADLMIFSEEDLGLRATELRPDLPGGAGRLFQMPTGVEWTIVNGQPVVAEGRLTGASPGAVLRSGRDTTTTMIGG